MTGLSPHLQRLEAEAIYILREGVAEASNPVILFSGGKDSTVLAHLALRFDDVRNDVRQRAIIADAAGQQELDVVSHAFKHNA